MTPPRAGNDRIRLLSAAAAGWLCLVLACAEGGNPSDRASEPGAAGRIDDWPCEAQGYPCTWEEVGAEATERSFALADQALDRFEPGTAAEVVAWLAAQPDVAESGEEDRSLIWFRVAEGRPVYVQGPVPSIREQAWGSSRGASLTPPRAVFHAGLGSAIGGGLRVLSRAVAARTTERPVGVTGRDRNDDRRVNQRDERRALILEPMDWEFCYEWYEGHYGSHVDRSLSAGERRRRYRLKRENRATIERICAGNANPGALEGLGSVPTTYRSEGQAVREVLEEMPAYAGRVTILTDEEVELEILERLDDYDVIHFNTHGSPRSIMIGTSVEWAGSGKVGGGAAHRRGLSVVVVRAGTHGERRRTWSADSRFIRGLHPGGLQRALIYLSSCSGLGHPGRPTPPLAEAFLGEESMVVAWGAPIGMNRATATAVDFYVYLAEGWAGDEAIRRIPDQYGEPVFAEEPAIREDIAISEEEARLVFPGGIDEYLSEHAGEEALRKQGAVFGSRGADMRIREVTRLLHPLHPLSPSDHQPVIEDGDDLERLVNGELGDGVDDHLRVTVEVEPIKSEEVVETRIHLELDGVKIGESEALWPEDGTSETQYRHHFENIPVGKDLEPETEYELEAVVALPEGGESRYAARLVSEACPVVLNGDFDGQLAGGHAQTFERDRITQAKIFLQGGSNRNPALHLTQQGARRDSWKFDLFVNLSESPSPGDRIRVEEQRFPYAPGTMPSPPPRLGGFYWPAGGEQWQFVRGGVNVLIHRVKWLDIDNDGGRTGMACGEVEASLEALVPGVYPFQYVPATIRADFRAEIRGRR